MSATTSVSRRPLDSSPNVITIPWTSASDGTYTEDVVIYGTILRVVTNPGSAAPTDNWDMVLNDVDGVDVFHGGGANRDTANSEDFVPVVLGSDGTTPFPVVVNGTLTLAITNAGSAKTGSITIYFR